jgi:DNA-binding LacI/PurR family transcriptional regulator
MATVYEVAKEAGVSISTVSRVLRNENKGKRVDSVERSARIREIADRLGYTQSWRAASFANGKTGGIGLVSEHSEWLFYGMMGQLAGELSRGLSELGHHLVVIPVEAKGGWKQLVAGGRVDGVVVLHHFSDAIREELASLDLPMIVVGDSHAAHAPRVLYADEGGAYAATRHLIELGHERIAMFARDTVRPHCSIDERRRGFEGAMREAGLGDGIFWSIPEEELLQLVVRSPSPPTAILCYCHVEAELLYQVAWRYGLSIPRDLSVIAFNDLPSTARMSPPLSTVGFDVARLGSTAAKLIVDAVEGRECTPNDMIVHPSLTLRASTAPPPSVSK